MINLNSKIYISTEGLNHTYTIEDSKPFASGFHGNVYLARRNSDGKLFALKMAKPETDKNLANKHVAELSHEHNVTIPILKKAGLIPDSFETHIFDNETALLKSFVRGPTLGMLIKEGDFFKPNSVSRAKFIALIQSQIKAGRFIGDLSPDNIIFTSDNRCIIIDSNQPVEGLDCTEVARLYRGESTVKYGEIDLNRYSLNASSGKWGKFVDKSLGGLSATERERIRNQIIEMINEITIEYINQ